MLKQYQTRTGETNGNCLEACIGCILNISVKDVPDFGGDDVVYRNMARFLNAFGLYYVRVVPGDAVLGSMFAVGRTFHTIEGLSPRGHGHACVGMNGSLVWDPHPPDGTGRGIVRVDYFGLIGSRMS